MLKEKELKKIADFILNQTKSYFDQTEVLLGTTDNITIRFANNLIYQSMAVTSTWLRIRLIKNKKIAVVSSNSLSPLAIKKIIQTGKNLCRFQKKDKNFISLPLSKKTKINLNNSFNQKTAQISPSQLARLIFPAIKSTLAPRHIIFFLVNLLQARF